MKYLLSLYEDEAGFAALSEEDLVQLTKEYFEYGDELERAGALVASEALQPTMTAKSLRVRDGKVSTTDGPFAETKEQLGGFYLLECDSMEQALEWAAKVPTAKTGTVEVRPIQDFERPA